jgi:molybdopterin/thiamine biosynthesis adenylyltransferase
MTGFDYERAFVRNLGFVTAAEQRRLRDARVAIAGLGGVGGSHLLTLARLGVGSFALAEMDRFELANFNRQAGAGCSTVGRPKLAVLEEEVRDINPELDLRLFPDGIDGGSVDRFLSGADLYLDGLDFFAFAARKAVFAACHRLGIPAVTAGPLGLGTALMTFLPDGPGFIRHMAWDDASDDIGLAVRFLVGLAPRALHRRALVDPTRIDLAAHIAPSSAAGIQLCAGAAAAEALKIITGRGRVRAAPWSLQFDAFSGRSAWCWRPGGNRHPLNRLQIAVAERVLRRKMGGRAA